MILLIDTSTPVCRLTLLNDDERFDKEWQADRTLARDLLKHLSEFLSEHDLNWSSLTGLGVYQGPGSFTGLRIGLTVFNTIADSEHIPIVGGRGDNWQDEVLTTLKTGGDDKIVLPFYGAKANITKARK